MKPLYSFLFPLSWDVTNCWVQNMIFIKTSDLVCQSNLANRELPFAECSLAPQSCKYQDSFHLLVKHFTNELA